MKSSKYNVIVPVQDKNYVFNLASQCLIEANRDIINYIKNDSNNLDLSQEEMDELYNNGIIVDSFDYEVSRLKSNVNSLKFDRSRFGVFLSLTSGCNLNCTYCYQDKRKDLNKKGYLTPENWKKLYAHFKQQIEKFKVKQFVVCLFGGEPMVDDAMLQKVVTDLRNLQNDNLKVQLVMITNGTLFTEENIDFYCNNIQTIQITLDGIKNVHDKFRIYSNGRGSFDTIVEKLKLIKDHNKSKDPCELSLRVNVNEDTVDQARELVDFIIEEGIDKSITTLAFHEIFGTQGDVIANNGDCTSNNVKLAEKIAALNFYVVSKGIKVYKDLNGPCIAKMATGYAVDEELNVYGCPGVIYSEVHGKLMEDGEIKVLDKTWYDYYLNDPKCVDSCKYAPICYGGCNWARGKNEKDCKKEIYDISIVPKLQTYIMSKYA
ncbi:TPA: radical SAM protein [Clostridium botulinum]|nr:radical SAM protein [Clostridium botulinum]